MKVKVTFCGGSHSVAPPLLHLDEAAQGGRGGDLQLIHRLQLRSDFLTHNFSPDLINCSTFLLLSPFSGFIHKLKSFHLTGNFVTVFCNRFTPLSSHRSDLSGYLQIHLFPKKIVEAHPAGCYQESHCTTPGAAIKKFRQSRSSSALGSAHLQLLSLLAPTLLVISIIEAFLAFFHRHISGIESQL